VTAQNYVIVRLRLANGVEGIGEAATLGGPRWAEESVEAIKANIDAYLAPALLGQRADSLVTAGLLMEAAAKRNYAAKAAIETAMFDAVGKTLGLPVSALLGGAARASVPVLWTLASGDAAQEIDEAEQKISSRLHRTFKIKIGAQAPDRDLTRLTSIAGALQGCATLIVDVNQAWDETVARTYLPRLRDLGITLVEQPVPAWNVTGLARLRQNAGGPPLLADECVFSPHDMMAVAQAG
jgi:muconate cycloisomerase